MTGGRDSEKWLAERLRADPEEALAYLRACWEPDPDCPEMTEEHRYEAFAMGVMRVFDALWWASARHVCPECKK